MILQAAAKMRNSLLSLSLVILTVYLGYSAFLYAYQPKLIYYPVRQLTATPSQIGLAYERVAIDTEDGVRLDGWFIPADVSRGTVLFFHGNAGNISHRLDSIAIFHKLNYSVLIFDYRGYGQSEGKPSEEGTYRDGEAAWRYLTEQKQVAPREIVFFGRSLGGAVATCLAARQTPRACILESVFTSAPDLAAQLFPLFPSRLLCRYDYNTAAAIKKINCPVLIIHSPQDDIIPFSHGRKLFEAASEPKAFLEIRGDHNTGFLASGSLYTNGLADFLEKYPGS